MREGGGEGERGREGGKGSGREAERKRALKPHLLAKGSSH